MPKTTKPVWILCPRCELNYIKKADKYCNVCKKEMKLIQGGEDDIGDLELCPICKINFVQNDEEICESCRQEMGIAVDEEREDKEIDDWHKYIDDDDENHGESEEDEDGLTDGIYDSSELEDSSGVVEGFDFDEDMEKDLADAAGEDDEDLDLDMIDDDEDDEEDEDDEDEDDEEGEDDDF